MYIPDPSNSANGAGTQSLSEVNGAPTNSQIHPPSESSYPQDFHEPSQNENRRGGRDAGKKKERSRSATNNHHSKHRQHRSPDKKSKSKSRGKSGTTNFKKKDKKKSSGGNSHSHSHGHSRGHHHKSTHHHSSSHHKRHRSPDRHRRTRSAENTLDSRHGGGRGRSPAKHHSHHRHHSSPQRHRSPRRGRSPYRSPYRRSSPYRHGSPHRQSSPHFSRYQSPNRYRSRSVDPYADRVANIKPEKEEDVALKEPPPPIPPSRSESVLTEAAAMDRLNRGDTLHRDPSSLLRDPSPFADRGSGYRGDSHLEPGMRDAIERAYREAVERERDRETQTLPRARTPNSSSAYNRYSSLLRGRSPEREDRLASPSARYRTRSLGRDLSPERSYAYEDEVEEEEYDQPDYYRVPRPTYDRVSNTLPEPRSRHYKDNPKDLSI